MENAPPDQVFDPKALDDFDYLVSCLKKNGIYIYLDAMTRDGGWSHGGGWGGDNVNRRQRLHWDPQARKDWAEAVAALLTHVNPYTKTTLRDDPAVAVILFCNEQEIDPRGMDSFPAGVLPGFRAWLKEKYGTDDALRTAWTDPAGVSHLPTGETLETVTADHFRGASPRSRDINLHIYHAEKDLLAWYTKTIGEIGYHGITTQYDCGMRYRDVAVRSEVPAISIHAYAAPVGNWVLKGSRQRQFSIIAAPDMPDALLFRYTADTRFLDRPLMITEYNFEFWSAFRHEEGLVMGGYPAFQSMDVLMAHSHPVMLSVDRPMLPYFVGADPIGRASQVVAGLLFMRGDVKPAGDHITLGLDEKKCLKRVGPGEASPGRRARIA